MNRSGFVGIFILTLAVTAPEVAVADWQIYFTGQAQRIFGSGGRRNFATRSECEAYSGNKVFRSRARDVC